MSSWKYKFQEELKKKKITVNIFIISMEEKFKHNIKGRDHNRKGQYIDYIKILKSCIRKKNTTVNKVKTTNKGKNNL